MDSVPSLKAWADTLGGIEYPLLSDFYPHGQAAQRFDVLRLDGSAERAIFVLDKGGVIRYAHVHPPDEQPDNEILFGVLAEMEPELAARWKESQPPHTATPTGPKEAPVTLYCTPWCPACRRARAFLQSHGIPFREIDISRDREAAARVRSWANGNESTPTFEIGGTIVVNYSEPKLREALGI